MSSVQNNLVYLWMRAAIIVVDGTIFSGVDYVCCLIMKALVKAKGNWVSGVKCKKSNRT